MFILPQTVGSLVICDYMNIWITQIVRHNRIPFSHLLSSLLMTGSMNHHCLETQQTDASDQF